MRSKISLKEQIGHLTLEQRSHLKEKIAALRAKQIKHNTIDEERIAIVGMSFRFPGDINDADSFWQLLSNQQTTISKQPPERQSDTPLKWQAGYLSKIDAFDTAFFNISPREAQLMDPQQRLLLQVIWHAIEDAGYNPVDFAKDVTGLFVGLSAHDYRDLLYEAKLHNAYSATGTSPAMIANRISYWFDFTGPSETIDTACASSLVALHHAVTAIKTQQCEQAIVGAANLLLTPFLFNAFEDAGMLSPTSSCKTFDSKADGYVRGEGVAAICLKTLSKAEEDGDKIYATILSSTVNHGGKANSLTAPNPRAQKALITSACQQARIHPNTISYIETHGTGTSLGDPIEIEALQNAFQEMNSTADLNNNTHCGLGTVKANIGHLEATAGLAGLIKVLLALQHQQLPGHVDFKQLNPLITLENTPFYIVEKTSAWPHHPLSYGRRAGISAFGFGGANAHVIVEESIPRITIHSSKPYSLITFSAKNASALQTQIRQLHAWLVKHPDSVLEEISYTLTTGRYHFDQRCVFIIPDIQTLQSVLVQAMQTPKIEIDQYLYYGIVDKQNAQLEDLQKLASVLLDEMENNMSDADKYRETLIVIAQLYAQGCNIAWEKLHTQPSKQRTHLPGYPFSEKRYWYSDQKTNPANTS